jgi:endoglucanase
MRQGTRPFIGQCSLALACCALLPTAHTQASQLVEVLPLTDQILMVHFDDGSVALAAPGQSTNADIVTVAPLDRTAAMSTSSYHISSTDDPAYATAHTPTAVGRKSKGTEFANHCDTWVGRCVNTSPDRALEHWVYLVLPSRLLHGRTYQVSTGSLASNATTTALTFDETRLRSEAVHVNIVAYATQAPQRYGYVYHWMGDRGGLDVGPLVGRGCHLVRTSDQTTVFDGTVAFRKSKTNVETAVSGDTPGNNFLGADVAECDFSSFSTPGEYVLSVDGVGCSFPFRIDEDALRSPFYAAMKGIFLQRSGMAITAPYGDGFTRPAPHNPNLTPGFAGRLKYTSTRYFDVSSGDAGDADKALWESGIKGDINTWGWYQDAGDWDSYFSHSIIPALLMALYEVHPDRFTDGELNIPESGNGLPDVLDEARWYIRFCHRTRHAILDAGYGTGGVGGTRVMGDLWGSDLPGDIVAGSWQDTQRMWIVSGEDPWITYRYAGLAAHFAYLLQSLGQPDPEGIDWRAEAQAAWTWAQANTHSGDSDQQGYSLQQMRMYAAAALYRLTGSATYHNAFKTDFATAGEGFSYDSRDWELMYARMPAGSVDATIQSRVRDSLIEQARLELASPDYDRATRWGGNFWMPMFLGQGSTPLISDGALSFAAVADQLSPSERQTMLAKIYTTADYFLGTNPLNMTWISRLGPRYPRGPFNLDAFTKGADPDSRLARPGTSQPGIWAPAFPRIGIIPYGPVAVARDWMGTPSPGPWGSNWVNSDVYPTDIETWPGHERWFDQRTGISTCEYTVHQTSVVAAVVYGILLEEPIDTRPHAPVSLRIARVGQ